MMFLCERVLEKAYRFPARFLAWCFIFLCSLSSYAQQAKQGAGVISTSKIVNEYAYLTADAKKGTSTLVLNEAQLNSNSRFSTKLSTGDLLFIIQAQGAKVSTANDPTFGAVLSYNGAGSNEFAQVRSVAGNTVTIDCALKNDYSAAGKTMVVRVPRYKSLSITNSGVLSADAWNGNMGGAVVLEVAGDIKLDGKIDVSAKGFRGGAYDNGTYNVTDAINHNLFVCPDSNASAEKGESIAGYQSDYDVFGGRYGRGAAANGGGGGNTHNAGGGGGANGGDISSWTGLGNPNHKHPNWVKAWNLEGSAFAFATSSGGGRGGYSYSKVLQDPLLIGADSSIWQGDSRRNIGGYGARPLTYDPSGSLVFFGGGGGAGDCNNHAVDTTGGNGGGMVIIVAKGNVCGNGIILADGEKGGDTSPSKSLNDGTGGGGAGGSVVLISSGTISGFSIQANGGDGGSQYIGDLLTKQKYEAEGMGGGGGGGYVATSNSLPSISVKGGNNGTTTSKSMLNFIHNGATDGGAGSTMLIGAGVYNPVKVLVKHDTLCVGQSATLTTNPIGGLASLVEWYAAPSGGFPLHTGGTYSFIANSDVCYYVQYCPNMYRDTVCAKVVAPPVIDLGKDVYLCAGLSLELDAGGAASYTWNTGERSQKITVKNAGKYWVTANVSQCGVSDSIQVYLSPNPFDLGSDVSVCEGNLALLDAGYWSSYLWSTGAKTKTIAVIKPGVYKVSVSSVFCSGLDSIKVTMLPLPSFTVSSDTLCEGGETELEVKINDPLLNPSNWIVQWQGGGSALKKTLSAEGKYLVKVTNKTTLCADTASGYVLIDPPFEIDLGPDRNICDGDSVLLKVPAIYSQYLWNGISKGASLLVKKTGAYNLEVTNSVGCSAQDNVQVNVLSFTGFTLGDDIVACIGQTVSIGTAIETAQYLWSTGAVLPQIVVDQDGDYILTLTNEIACAATDTVNVQFLPYPKVYPANDTVLCFLDAKGEVEISAEFKPNHHYLWSTGDTTAAIIIKNEGVYLLKIQLPAVSCVYNKAVKVDDYCDANIFFPNAFTPNSDGINDVFYTPNFALKSYRLLIFDRWGK
ncbi:MAG: gliding motility-associated C-terminal domain-containing protein, partial [Bacteroidetes bacterium]|nr:gliding motility-associated C-terminal domain-containing protein [Bacteroidota bacterium]